MHLVTYLQFQQASESTLASSYTTVCQGHVADADVHWMTGRFARQCEIHADALQPVLARLDTPGEPVPERLHVQGLTTIRAGLAGLLRDLQELYQLVSLVDTTWSLVGQAAQAIRDWELIKIVEGCAAQTTAQLDWLRMRMQMTAPQALLVAV
ncbi:hypothetical protein ACGFSG_25925 [Streptomyces sp. NPDC048512]|uniref:hypothetical protein n=1 Tax=Streptomyces sp. NPDC048512 TaxID=3365563 RepID=UPI00371D19BB